MRTWKTLPWSAFVVAAILLIAAAPVAAHLQIGDFSVLLGDRDVTVHAMVVGVIPPAFDEGVRSGIPTTLRVRLELWQYNRLWPDRLIDTRIVERRIVYNVVTQEFTVAFLAGEAREPHVSRHLPEALRALSELHGIKLLPTSQLDPAELFYARIRADVALGGANNLLARLSGEAEQTGWVHSSLLTLHPRP